MRTLLFTSSITNNKNAQCFLENMKESDFKSINTELIQFHSLVFINLFTCGPG
jgi:hypothetical protein